MLNKRVLVCILEQVFAASNIQRTKLSCSSVLGRKKTKFYNQYIKEYKPRIYKGFVDPLLEKTESQWMVDFDEDVPDYQQLIIREARRRQNIYERKKLEKSVEGKKYYENPFTVAQMNHIKFLHGEDSSLWSASNLAMSFGVEAESGVLTPEGKHMLYLEVIKRILKKKLPLKTNTKVLNKTFGETPHPTRTALIEGASNSNASHLSLKDYEERTSDTSKLEKEVKNNPWFKPFDQSAIHVDDEIELIEEEEALNLIAEESELDDHFYELYDSEEHEVDEDLVEVDEDLVEVDEDLDVVDENLDVVDEASNHEDNTNEHLSENDEADITVQDDLLIRSTDRMHYYDNEGRFVYKVA